MKAALLLLAIAGVICFVIWLHLNAPDKDEVAEDVQPNEGDSIAYKQMPNGKIRPVRNVTLNVSLEKE